MTVTYESNEKGDDVIGTCSQHGSFVGDAIGCPGCFALEESAQGICYECLDREDAQPGVPECKYHNGKGCPKLNELFGVE